MNYLAEILAFYDWLEGNPLPPSAIALWHALMSIANGAKWVKEVHPAISTLQSKTGMGKDAICEARRKLQQCGRIEWEKRAGNQSAEYIIIPFVSDKPTQSPTQVPTQVPTQSPTQVPTIYKLNKTKRNETNNTPHTPHEQAEEGKPDGGGTLKPRSRRKARNTESKLGAVQFAEFVSMTNDEHTSLVAKLGEHGAERCIEILDNYKGSSGKKYASDYRAILNWVVKRYAEESGTRYSTAPTVQPIDTSVNPFAEYLPKEET